MNTEVEPNRHNYLFLREDIHRPLGTSGMSETEHRALYTTWHRHLTTEQRNSHALLTGQVFGLLGVNSYAQIQSMLDDSESRLITSRRVAAQLGKIFGITDPVAMRDKYKYYSDNADSVRDYLQEKLSYEGSPNLEMVNEVRATTDPADLLLITLDGTWSARARWDAKVKSQLMYLDGLIDRRQREIGIEDQFTRFVYWMKERVWNSTSLGGDSSGAFLVSTHDPDTWICTSARWVNEEEGNKLQLQPFQKKTHLYCRNTKANSQKGINAYITIREKTPTMKNIKMLRKRAENPAIAVDDDTGLLLVVNNILDVRKIINHLLACGYQSDDPITIEEVSDTLTGGEHKGNPGSSSLLKQMKFFFRLANKMRVECIVHTPRTYATNLYARGISHNEYEINRLFDTGVPDLIYPKSYFPLFDSNEAKRQSISRIRRGIECATLY